MICLGMAASFLINIIISIFIPANDNQTLGSESSITRLLYCIGTIVVASVVEEIIYRELIFRDLMTVISLPLAIVISSFFYMEI